MSTPTHQTIRLRLEQVIVSDDFNPRKGELDGIAELAASIKANGLLQPIVVRLLPYPPETYGVVAGHRRFAAIQSLGWRDAEFILTDAENAHELALTENVMRQAMHPVDEYRAFAQLVKDGLKPKQIATRFGLKEREVKQRLALGKMLPAMLEHWRAGKVDDAAAKAMAQTDHAFQQALLDAADGDFIDEYDVTSRLDNERMDTEHATVLFVGLDAYKKAGGKIDRDLFGDDEWIANPTLIHKLNAEKRDAVQAAAQAEGWKAVYWGIDPDAPSWNTHTQVYHDDATALEPEERAEIELTLRTDYRGGVSRTLWKPRAPTQTVTTAAGTTVETAKPGASLMADPDLSKALSADMAHVMTGFAHAYAQREENRHTVLAFLAYMLTHPMATTPLRIRPNVYLPNQTAKELIGRAWPKEEPLSLDVILGLETDDVVNLIWQGAAKAFHFTDGADSGKPELRAAWYRRLATYNGTQDEVAAAPDGWRPDSDNYFKRMTKDQILAAMKEMSTLGDMKLFGWVNRGDAGGFELMVKNNGWLSIPKGVLADKATTWARASGWLPKLLRPDLTQPEPAALPTGDHYSIDIVDDGEDEDLPDDPEASEPYGDGNPTPKGDGSGDEDIAAGDMGEGADWEGDEPLDQIETDGDQKAWTPHADRPMTAAEAEAMTKPGFPELPKALDRRTKKRKAA